MNAYEKAISLLKIRPHHSEELTKKLLMRGFDREDVASVIKKLEEEKLLDNDQFAQVFLDNLVKYKTFGFYGLKSKLMQRGMESFEAEALLKKNLSFEKEKEIALKIVERAGDLDKLKLMQKLSRKGFRTEVIREIIASASERDF